MTTKSEKQYVFKPMTTLTPWTLGLIVAKLLAMIVWTAGQTAYLFNDGLYDVVEVPVSIAALLYVAIKIVRDIHRDQLTANVRLAAVF